VQFTSLFFLFYIKGVLKRRDQIQGELESRVDALANKKTEKDLVSMYRMLKSSRPYSNYKRRSFEESTAPEAMLCNWMVSLLCSYLF